MTVPYRQTYSYNFHFRIAVEMFAQYELIQNSLQIIEDRENSITEHIVILPLL